MTLSLTLSREKFISVKKKTNLGLFKDFRGRKIKLWLFRRLAWFRTRLSCLVRVIPSHWGELRRTLVKGALICRNRKLKAKQRCAWRSISWILKELNQCSKSFWFKLMDRSVISSRWRQSLVSYLHLDVEKRHLEDHQESCFLDLLALEDVLKQAFLLKHMVCSIFPRDNWFVLTEKPIQRKV